MTPAEARALKRGDFVRYIPFDIVGEVQCDANNVSVAVLAFPAGIRCPDVNFMERYECVAPSFLDAIHARKEPIVASAQKEGADVVDDNSARRIRAKRLADDIDKMAGAILKQTETVAQEKATLTQMNDFREKLVNHLISVDRGDDLQLNLYGEDGGGELDVDAFLKGLNKATRGPKKGEAAAAAGAPPALPFKEDKKEPKWKTATMSDLGILEPMASYLSNAKIHTLAQLKELQDADPWGWWKKVDGLDHVSSKQLSQSVNQYLLDNNEDAGNHFLGLMLKAKDADVGRKVFSAYDVAMGELLKRAGMPQMVGQIEPGKYVSLAGTKMEDWNKVLLKLSKIDLKASKKVLELLNEGRMLELRFNKLLDEERLHSEPKKPPLVGGTSPKPEARPKPERKAKPASRPKAKR